MQTLEQFIGLYPLTKTIRFKLVPVGKTAEKFYQSGMLNRDKKRADNYPAVKKLIDECHKYLINESLKVEHVRLDWSTLKNAIEAYRKDKSEENKKALERIQGEMRSHIFKKLKDSPFYSELTAATPKDLLKDSNLLNSVLHDNSIGKEEKDIFEGFATYFKGFQENRRNIYTDEAISTGVPFRTVHDNFPKFLTNIEIYATIKNVCPNVLEDVGKELQPFLDGVCLDDVFTINFYNSLLNQNGIDYFNQIIGGVTLEEGKKKLRGINELVNQYLQQHPELKISRKGLTMVPLFKQILSDRETFSFVPQAISSDKELIETIKQFHENITHMEIDGEKTNIIEKLCSLLSTIQEYEAEHIFINSKSITDLSLCVCKSWSRINECLKKKAIETYGTRTKAALKKVDAYLKRQAYSLADLSCVDADLTLYFFECVGIHKEIIDKYALFTANVNIDNQGELKNDVVRVEFIKDVLDAYMKLLHKAESVSVPEELDIDKSFYTIFSRYYDVLRSIIPVYTKVRNYLTQKPYNEEKFKLNFDAPTLANGWDKNKEEANKAILLFKGGKSYLAITAPSAKVKWETYHSVSDNSYSKLVYKLLPGPNKMLPKVFFSRKGIETYHPSDYILTGFKAEWYKKGKSFNKQFLHDLIDFYKASILQHPDWKNFGFVFSPTNTYEDISAFYNEISMQAYKLNFVDISVSTVDKLVDEGKVFLFQIYNKDYAEGSKGSKNLHTLYWENLFSKENRENLVLKLNGEAELFYRNESIKKPLVHKVGDKMLNKRCKTDGSDKSGMPIPDAVYMELYRYFNGKIKKDDLSSESNEYLNHVVVKEVKHEIIKDRRYTQPHFQFHVPLTINFRASGNERINGLVNEYLKDNSDVNIIGLDRGERH
ncbi:MAG: type V CRISPR-associated protein Cas12a/Cpf1, partial [Prevotella sp.]